METILLLEDEDSVNRGVAFALEKDGYRVVSCTTISEAKIAFIENKPELIISDINLLDGNGLSYIRWIRERSEVFIICLTALNEEMDEVMGYEAGADDYVIKPFRLSVLLLKVGAYFKRKNQQAPAMIRSGEIIFYPNEMKVIKNNEELALTKTEWKMLSLFLEHPRQILSKQQILEQLFDVEGNYVDDNTIAVNIRRLREKIETDVAHPEYIRNVRGLGYIWDKERE